jgi:nitrogen fixation/metabolism regulation signal transduction histidine kinase
VDSFNRMMEELKDSRHHIIQAEKESAWREMARQIAHEIKNPLTPMRLSASHILKAHRDEHPKFDRILAEGLERIAAQVDALGKIASEFSDFARFPHANIQPNDLNAVVSNAVRLVAEEVRDADPAVTVKETYGDLPAVPLDRDEMERAVINVVKNAVQALREEGGTVRVLTRLRGQEKGDSQRRKATRRVAKTERRLRPKDRVVEIVVTDDGPGIPAEIQPRLFEPYFSTKSGGTGLGLAICKRSITQMGGEIAIDSEEGVGTTVTVRLPVDANRAQQDGTGGGEARDDEELPDRRPGSGT